MVEYIGIGDLIEYAGNGITVMIYARKIVSNWYDPAHDRIVDGNVSCCRKDVVWVVHTVAQLAESHANYTKKIRGTTKGGK